jgi:hypothetical protein
MASPSIRQFRAAARLTKHFVRYLLPAPNPLRRTIGLFAGRQRQFCRYTVI